jgi:uncharacterized OB-fold protein
MEVPRHWRLKKQRYALVGEVCPNCNAPLFTPRAVCPYCGGDTTAQVKADYPFEEQPAAIVLEQALPTANR